ncbi:MAG: HAMP domain-containing histidine kinase [bacterium]|nr:HAMP domain-containing histidine kinase [bacterium]
MPVWLWDVECSRIAWANRACLEFCGALTMNELIRLKFQHDAPFARQLARLSKQQMGVAGVRELLRFPTKGGEFILDCLCSSLEIESGRAGVLVELVADKGMVKSALDEAPAEPYKNGHLESTEKESGLMVDQIVQHNPKAQSKYMPAIDLGEQVASADTQKPENAMNGLEIEAGQVDDEDLRTLREIALMINGPGGGAALGVAQANVPSGSPAGDGRPVVATRKTGAMPNADKPSSLVEKDHSSTNQAARAERQSDQPSPIVGGERNYFLESLPAALAIAMGGRLIRANKTFLYAFGFGSESELRKAGGLAALFPRSQNGVLIEDGSTLDAEQSKRQKSHSARIETLAISRSGRQRHIPIAFRNVSTGHEPVQILILHEDALWQDENSLEAPELARQEYLRDDPQNIGQDSIDFLATVSHEVRTPLNSIIGFSELMKDERFGTVDVNRFRGYAADIHASAVHALSLINDLLDITKIMAGKPDLEFADVEIDGVIIDALNGMRVQAQKKQIILQFSIEDGLPALYADKRSLKQILLNLISNAVKFTQAGGQVSVSARPSASHGVILSVTDTGIGMQADEIGTALEPFAQIKTAQNSNFGDMSQTEKGSGLGLPLTKALVKAHHASFNIVSTPGRGTTIEIHFPAERLAR